MSVEQHVTADSGYAYGVIGADIHVFGDGSPVYLLRNWRPAPAADPAWLRELPSRMLNSRFAVVPFTGRDAELAELRAWRDQEPSRLAVHWVHAPGGQGKTRLAARFADETLKTGWRVVTATNGPGSVQPPPGSEDLSLDGHGGVLLVVDYADRWPLTHLTWLLSNALLHRPGVRTRVLMLARTADAWPALRASLANHQAGTSSRLLGELPDGSEARAEMYRAARDAFAVRYGVPAAPGPGPPPPYGLTLALHIAALVSVDAHAHGRLPPTDVAGLTVYLLDREHLHWGTLFARGGRYATPPQAMNRTVFAAALTGTLDRPKGSAVVAGLGTGHSPGRVLDDHGYCYPAAEPERGTVLEPLYPDRLAEDFLALTLPGHDADYPAADWSGQVTARLVGPHARRAVTFLATAAQRWPHLGPGHLYPMLLTAPSLALAAGSAALSALAALDDVPVQLLATLSERFPAQRQVNLDTGIAAVQRRFTHELLALDDSPATRAAAYHHLSSRLQNAGLLDEALDAAERSLAAQEELPEDIPALATSLSRLAACLAPTGRLAEAISLTERSAALFGRLAESDPERWEASVAAELTDLANWLSSAGRHAEALAVSERAVSRWRRLGAADPLLEEHLSIALHALGNCLAGLGRWPEAADATFESLRLAQRFIEQDPAAHEPGLAAALINLSVQLAAQGRHADALRASEGAVSCLRYLVRVNAAAHEKALATALTSMSDDLANAGRHQEALDATAEAVAIHRRRAAGHPSTPCGELAQSLSNLAHLLLMTERPAEALSAAEESLEIHERLYAQAPELHGAGLGHAVSILSRGHVEAGRPLVGLVFAVRAVNLYEAASAGNPGRYALPLVRALGQLAETLALAGRPHEALAVCEDALARASANAAENPPAYGQLLTSLLALRSRVRRERRPGS
ncbi:tetratricopeptide repeat protein [Streptomyces purpureus]|uniref:tetratricopeptide repeat protein n=1 Tax=Streptomyces purpureus TaxID=1951 RepID=UPI0003603625|nr:tetratricopeptide repeat protein [Streptomyces purpureus]